jgi:hypothetical protein
MMVVMVEMIYHEDGSNGGATVDGSDSGWTIVSQDVSS